LRARSHGALRLSCLPEQLAHARRDGLVPLPRGVLVDQRGDRDIYDTMGKDAMVFHHSVHSGQPTDIPYIEQSRTWFASMWDTISYEYPA
jgi:hypothetical protein